MATVGLRYAEARSIQWADLDLAASLASLRVKASCSKNRRESILPLPAWLATKLHVEREKQSKELGRVVGGPDPVLHVPVNSSLNEQLRKDATCAGLPLVDEKGRRLDVHSLRHSCCANLARAGVGLKQAMQIMRHSDPKLTAKVYGQLDLVDLSVAVDQVPSPVVGAGVRKTRRAKGQG